MMARPQGALRASPLSLRVQLMQGWLRKARFDVSLATVQTHRPQEPVGVIRLTTTIGPSPGRESIRPRLGTHRLDTTPSR